MKICCDSILDMNLKIFGDLLTFSIPHITFQVTETNTHYLSLDSCIKSHLLEKNLNVESIYFCNNTSLQIWLNCCSSVL